MVKYCGMKHPAFLLLALSILLIPPRISDTIKISQRQVYRSSNFVKKAKSACLPASHSDPNHGGGERQQQVPQLTFSLALCLSRKRAVAILLGDIPVFCVCKPWLVDHAEKSHAQHPLACLVPHKDMDKSAYVALSWILVERWPETGFVKKLQRRDNTFYYYDRERECEDKEVHKVKVYAY
ncbi:hypothetical protein EYD10_07503 [Varanus komodoensis]|nr:hypothetical protein EYD10_07503 [Varanus komodoensis]